MFDQIMNLFSMSVHFFFKAQHIQIKYFLSKSNMVNSLYKLFFCFLLVCSFCYSNYRELQ